MFVSNIKTYKSKALLSRKQEFYKLKLCSGMMGSVPKRKEVIETHGINHKVI